MNCGFLSFSDLEGLSSEFSHSNHFTEKISPNSLFENAGPKPARFGYMNDRNRDQIPLFTGVQSYPASSDLLQRLLFRFGIIHINIRELN